MDVVPRTRRESLNGKEDYDELPRLRLGSIADSVEEQDSHLKGNNSRVVNLRFRSASIISNVDKNIENRIRSKSQQEGAIRQYHNAILSYQKLAIMEMESWVPNFMDLIYVTIIYSIEQFYVSCGVNYASVNWICLTYFTIMFSTRKIIDEYGNVFLSNDVLHRIIFFLFSLGVFIMAMNISFVSSGSDAHATYGHCTRSGRNDIGFTIGFIATRLMIGILYAVQLIWIDLHKDQGDSPVDVLYPGQQSTPSSPSSARNSFSESSVHAATHQCLDHVQFRFQLQMEIVSNVCAALIMSIVLMSTNDKVLLVIFPTVIGVEFLFDLFIALCVKDKMYLDPNTLQERNGFFVMIVLGEGIIGVINQGTYQNFAAACVAGIFSFTLVFSIGMQFFDTAHRPLHDHEIDMHALEKSSFSSLCYIWMYDVTSFFIFVATVGMIQIFILVAKPENIAEEEMHHLETTKHYYRIMMAVGMAGEVLCILVMKTLHKSLGHQFGWHRRAIINYFKLITVGLHIAVYWGLKDADHLQYDIIAHSVIVGFCNSMDVIVNLIHENQEKLEMLGSKRFDIFRLFKKDTPRITATTIQIYRDGGSGGEESLAPSRRYSDGPSSCITTRADVGALGDSEDEES